MSLISNQYCVFFGVTDPILLSLPAAKEGRLMGNKIRSSHPHLTSPVKGEENGLKDLSSPFLEDTDPSIVTLAQAV
jgi:hypothetical protein